VKRRNKKLLSLVFTGWLLLASLTPASVSADEPYDVYNYDRFGEAIPSQAGYIADRAVSGNDLGIGHFNSPNDIFRDYNDIFFIADSGNNRIVAVNSDFTEAVKVYDEFTMPDGSKTFLNNPMSVFVSKENGMIYIADSDNARVLVCNRDAGVVREITKPASEVFDQKKTFLPQKVIADKAGNVYVVLGNITTGAAMFNSSGEFMGFYGANRVEPTAEIVKNYFMNLFTSEEKKARKSRNVPTGITSFDIDGDFIFTCTSSITQGTDTVKKLNAAGDNIFSDMELLFGDFTPVYDTNHNKKMQAQICDIDISDDGNINCLDFTTGRVFQYDEDCNLLFIMGTIAKQLGGFDQVSALESMGSNIYVLDMQKNTVTIFVETSFGKIVHEAASLFNAGYYEEALQPWYEVLKRDGNYRRAYIGVASALLNAGDYEGAMKYAKLADMSSIYNKAFEGYRRDFLKDNFTSIVIAAVLFAAVFIVLRKIINKRRAERKESEAEAVNKSIKEKEGE